MAGEFVNQRIGIVLDDLQMEAMVSTLIAKLFTTYGHHLFEQTFFSDAKLLFSNEIFYYNHEK